MNRYGILALTTSAQAGPSVLQQGLGVLAPFLIAQFALSKAQLGVLFSALFLSSALFVAVSGVLTDRVGERTMLLASGVVMTIALVAATFVPHYGWLVFWMFVFGLGYAVQTPAGGRAVLGWFDVRSRGVAMGVRQTGVPVGGFIGALLLPAAAAHGGYAEALLVTAVLVVVPTVLAFALYRDPPIARKPSGSMRSLFGGMGTLARDPRLIAVALTSVVLVSVQAISTGFFTVSAIAVLGLDARVAASAYGLAFLAAIAGRLVLGWFSDRFLGGERIAVLAAMSALAGVAVLFFALLRAPNAALVVPAALLIGFSAAGWNGIMAAALAEIGGAERAGSALGLVLTAVFLASGSAPVAFGALADRTSLVTAWYATALLALLGVIPALWVRLRLVQERPDIAPR